MEMNKPNKNPNPNTPNSISSSSSSSSSSSEINPSKMAENKKPEQHKKQVRRRLHTTRPYQERLMNMAEARREIVTALRHHRAAMKNAAGGGAVQSPPDPPPRSQERRIRPRKIPKSSVNNNNYNVNLNLNLCYPWMMMEEANNLEIELPEQTLGLNLNLNNLDASLFSNGSVSGSSSSEGVKPDGGGGGGGGGGVRHVAVGEEEMAEIRSIGEKHSVEWSDKMSMVKSAWWLKFMKMEEGEFEFEFKDPFDQILEFPDWINNGNQTCFEQPLFTDYHPSSALPCMDIGEFEGMDGEWLA